MATRGQVPRVFDTRANGPGELAEEVGEGDGKFSATGEPTLVPELSFDAIVV